MHGAYRGTVYGGTKVYLMLAHATSPPRVVQLPCGALCDQHQVWDQAGLYSMQPQAAAACSWSVRQRHTHPRRVQSVHAGC